MLSMTRTRGRPMHHASLEYKRWVRRRVGELGLTQEQVVAGIKRIDARQSVSSEAYALAFGGADKDLKASNISYKPALDSLLADKAKPPPEVVRLQDQLEKRWPDLNERERAALVALIGNDRTDTDR